MQYVGQRAELYLPPLLTCEARAMAGGKAGDSPGSVFLSSFSPTLAICLGCPTWRMLMGVWIPLVWILSIWVTGGLGLTLKSTRGTTPEQWLTKA